MRRKVRSGNPAEVVLSDRNPNKAAMARVDTLGDPATRYRAGSVDAMTGGGKLNGIRTRQVRRGGSRRADAGANGSRCVGDAGLSPRGMGLL